MVIKVEEGESVAVAAIREVEEECGITGPVITEHLLDTYHTYVHNGNRVLKRTYWYRMDYDGMEQVTPQTEEGITRVEWRRPDNRQDILNNTYGSIVDLLRSSHRSDG